MNIESEINHYQYVLDFSSERFYMRMAFVVVMLVASLVQWLIIVYAHPAIAVIAATILSWILSQFYQALSNATPNGGSNRIVWQKPFIICLAIILTDTLGMYILSLVQTDKLSELYFILWLAIAIGAPVIYLTVNYVRCSTKLSQIYENYVRVSLHISHNNDLPVKVTDIRFYNTSNNKTSYINIKNNFEFYTQAQLQKENLKSRVSKISNTLFNEGVIIPKNTNEFILSWYSVIEEKYYSDTFTFKYDRFEVKDSMGGGLDFINSIELHIVQDGAVDFYKSGWLILHYTKTLTKEITTEYVKKYTDDIRYGILSGESPSKFNSLLNEIKTSGRLERSQAFRTKRFCWSLSVEGVDEIKHSIKIEDAAFNNWELTLKRLNVAELRSLPEKLTIYKSLEDDLYFYLYIYLDRNKMYDSVMMLTSGNEEVPVELSIKIINRMKKEMKMKIKTADRSIDFSDWAIDTTGV